MFFLNILNSIFNKYNILLQGFPSEGINIFGSQLHTHGTGVEVETRHFRNGI